MPEAAPTAPADVPTGGPSRPAPRGRPAVGLSRQVLAPHAVARWAAEAPDRVALQHVDGGTVTYGELDRRCRRWAAAYARLGVAPGEHVATMLANGPDAYCAWIGLGWLRAVEVPLNPALKGRLLAEVLGDCDASLMVVGAATAGEVAAVARSAPGLRRLVVLDDRSGAGLPDAPAGLEVVDGTAFLSVEPATDLEGPAYRDIAALLYTSGTTGRSKGVRVPWATVYHMWSWAPADAFGEGEGLYCAFSMFHNSGKSSLNQAMARGARFVWRDRFSAAELLDDVRRADCVCAAIVGPMLAYLYSLPERPDDADTPLRAMVVGPMIPEIESLERRFGVKVCTCYGTTETGAVLATGWDHGPAATCGRQRLDYPWPEVRVVDEHDEPLGPGEVGELVVRTAEPWALNAGYHGRAERTAEAWRNGWFHTGDAFRYDEDGWYYLVDRLSDAIRRRGENISSFEIEQILRDHPGVVDCAAVGVPAEFGEEEVLVVVEAADPAGFDPAALVAWAAERLPRHMVPRYVHRASGLPRNETSLRVQKFKLRAAGLPPGAWDRLAAGSPD
ncbi:MAG: AMP-binding protein [Acidimicrobiales bacterium]